MDEQKNLVICFYPGGGGHRLRNKLLNRDFTAPNIAYDFAGVKDLTATYRYLDNLSNFADSTEPIILTHCMDVDLIRETLPNRKVMQIISDYKKSLKRQWDRITKHRQKKQFENELDSAYTFIKWHQQYYQNYPLNGQADEIINIDTDVDEFTLVMRRELNLDSDIFDLAWDVYNQFGDDAPTITLYEEYINNAQK